MTFLELEAFYDADTHEACLAETSLSATPDRPHTHLYGPRCTHACVLGPDGHEGLHRDKDGNTWGENDDRAHAAVRIDMAKRALVQTGYFTADEVSDDIAPRITEYAAAQETERFAAQREANDLAEALRLTVEYVGTATLPPVMGWSWYDALLVHRPDIAARFRDDWEQPVEENYENVEAVPLNVGEPMTRIRVYKTESWWKPWHADITFRGIDLDTIRGWDEAEVEQRAYDNIERRRAKAEKRASTYRIIDIKEH